MKKLLILMVECAMLGTPAIAVQKCVAFNENVDIGTNYSDLSGRVDWFQDLDNGVMVRGVSACSSETGETYDIYSDKYNGLPVRGAGNIDEHKNCWCKMTTPAESYWVYIY